MLVSVGATIPTFALPLEGRLNLDFPAFGVSVRRAHLKATRRKICDLSVKPWTSEWSTKVTARGLDQPLHAKPIRTAVETPAVWRHRVAEEGASHVLLRSSDSECVARSQLENPSGCTNFPWRKANRYVSVSG